MAPFLYLTFVAIGKKLTYLQKVTFILKFWSMLNAVERKTRTAMWTE